MGLDWTAISGDVVTGVTEIVTGAGEMVVLLIPVGIGLLLVLSAPRIIRRVVNTFI
jgi:hypothetical protein